MKLVLDPVTLKKTKLEISSWCRLLRKENGETQISLARKLNLSHKTIYNLEKGSNFTVDTLLKVLQYFDRIEIFYGFLSDQVQQEEEKNKINFY